ncbi:MAG: WecB/TagA/CpsF family glycosyltransferase [Xenococcaceae cyanobacterium MO_167.B52]|nr:WecB/TagA/CpsF family glycosyltransferase [Xenococcaceae cyanobacterium MO_167.B52]
MKQLVKKVRIISTFIHNTSYQDACNRITHWVKNHTSCYIVAANVHVVMMGYWDRKYREILNNAELVTPDGMPLVWGMRLLGIKNQTRVYGPDLMMEWCDHAAKMGIPIYLYGGKTSTLEKLQNNLKQKFPNLIIAGTHAPPFRPLTEQEETEDRERIHHSGAKVVFVGLGCPKQEQWMARQKNKLQTVMIGVGAAFSFHSGEVDQAPRWMMKIGFEWLYRFSQEPKRLWQRYLINNPAFVALFIWKLLKHLSSTTSIIPFQKSAELYMTFKKLK